MGWTRKISAPFAKEFSMSIKFVGIDLAKSVFQIHSADEAGHVILRKTVTRAKLLDFVRQLEPAVIGMEACSTAHYWGRRLVAFGHDVRLMPPAYVKPFVKTNKNDQADAEAICEAVQRPNMRFVTIKTPDQQAVLLLHRARTGPLLRPLLPGNGGSAGPGASGRGQR